ncbi:MAG: hypothetical protein K0R55_3660 [Sporomusa sp.]|nr:hypothetical protein [Sporomusa sp.]
MKSKFENLDTSKIMQHNGKAGYTAIFGWQDSFGANRDELVAFGYIESFKNTADLMVEQNAPDLNLFPVIFNYRQYLELVLKNFYSKQISQNVYRSDIRVIGHDLNKLWDKVEPYIANYVNTSGYSAGATDFIKQVVMIFHNIDPNSFNYRYPTDKRLNQSITTRNLTIDLWELKESIEAVDEIMFATYGL